MGATLVELEDADFAWMLDGTPGRRGNLRLPPGGVDEAHVLAHVRSITAKLAEHDCRSSWMIVCDDEVVGLCGYKRPPAADGEVDIGYSIAPSRRRRGYATGAVKALLKLARLDPAVRTVVAETVTTNVVSGRVLKNNGFQRAGMRVDKHDGEEVIVWRTTVK